MDARSTRILATLFMAIFAVVLGVGIVVPLLPMHAHGMGARGITIGLLFTSFALARAVFVPGFGRLSDRVGRKPLIVAGMLGYALVSVAFAFVENVASLLLVRLLHGVASAMLMPVIQAYVGDLAPQGREGRVMGLHGAFVLTGLSLGPVIGGALHDAHGMRAAFLCMGALALAASAACQLLLPAVANESATHTRRDGVSWRRFVRDRALLGLVSVRFGYVVCIALIWGFLPLFAAVDLALPATSVGAIVALGILASGALNAPMGYLADRVDRRAMVVAGAVLAAVAMAALTRATSLPALAGASVVFGVGGGVCMPALMALATRRGQDVNAMGSVMAMVTMAHSTGMLAGSLLGGIILEFMPIDRVFLAGTVTLAITTGVFVLTRPGETRSTIPVAAVEPVAAHR